MLKNKKALDILLQKNFKIIHQKFRLCFKYETEEREKIRINFGKISKYKVKKILTSRKNS